MSVHDEYLREWVRKAEEATIQEAWEAGAAVTKIRRFMRSRLGLPE